MHALFCKWDCCLTTKSAKIISCQYIYPRYSLVNRHNVMICEFTVSELSTAAVIVLL
jgi:hypothetical protein